MSFKRDGNNAEKKRLNLSETQNIFPKFFEQYYILLIETPDFRNCFFTHVSRPVRRKTGQYYGTSYMIMFFFLKRQFMDSKFWHECWENKNLGFNQKSFNLFLKNFFPELSLDSNASILVPLCGKSIDLLWLLKQGYQVTGVELSPLAIKEFFEEHKIPFTKGTIGPYTSWQAVDKKLLLLEGNFFELSSLSQKEFKESHLQTLSAIYDRASLVALPKAMRIDYYNTLKKLLPPSTSLFLITVEYDQSKVDGPPFSVPEQEIREFLGESFAIKIRHSETQKSVSPRFLSQGVTSLTSKIYQLKKL